jgi:hypothetical protein
MKAALKAVMMGVHLAAKKVDLTAGMMAVLLVALLADYLAVH